MQNTTSLFNQILSGPHTHEVKLNISGRDYGMDVLASLKTSLAPFGSGSPVIGLTAGTLSVNHIGAGSITESKIQDYTLDS